MNLNRLLLLLGLDSAERDRQVAAALKDIYDEEMQGYRLVGGLSISLQLAIDDVAKALGSPGTALPANVPAAAALLGEYADAFSALETTSNYLVLDLQESIDVLEGRV